MKNLVIYLKNIIVSLLFVFLIAIGYLKNCTAAETTASTSKVNSSLGVEDVKKIPILGYKLVYKQYNASLIDFLENEKTDFINLLKSNGITPHNIVIIFTDYEGSNKTATNAISSSIHITSPYVTDEGKNMDLSNFYESDLPFLVSKRNVLLGTLVDDSNAASSNSNFNVVNFNMPDAIGFQIPIKTITASNNNNNTTKDISAKNKQNKTIIDTNYSLEELLKNRISMIRFMNLSNFSKTNFVGLLEYKDLSNNLYSYFAIPGELQDFLNKKN